MNEPNLADPIEGYEIIVVKRKPDTYKQVITIPLRLNQAGGVNLAGPDDLVMLIEDAIHNNEKDNGS